MKIKLSDNFTYGKLLKFTFPSIAMMIFTSIYGVVDGFFVSNYVGKTAFAAVNFIMPPLIALGALGFMLGTGGSALVAKNMGEGNEEHANRLFSMLIYGGIILGIIFGALGIFAMRPIAMALGAEGELLEKSVIYGIIISAALPAFLLQMEFQSFFITAEKPNLGFAVTLVAGVVNIILDALFVACFSFGIVGAALASAISQLTGAIVPLLYFAFSKKSILKLGKSKLYGRDFLKVCTNGSSEFVTNISMSVVAMLYNFQLLKYSGEDGVAAYGVLMYVGMIFCAAFIGYSIGVAAPISYHFGANNKGELKNLFKKSFVIITSFSVFMLLSALLLAKPLSILFVGYDKTLFEITQRAFYIFSFSFLFSGIAIFGSSFFTALNDGVSSATISFIRTLFFQISSVLLLPIFFGVDGIWASIVVAEGMSAILTLVFFATKRKKFGYW